MKKKKREKKKDYALSTKITPRPIPFPTHTLAFEVPAIRQRACDLIRAQTTSQTIAWICRHLIKAYLSRMKQLTSKITKFHSVCFWNF